MIPTTNPSTVTTHGLQEARDFTIATTGKAFKTLIDGLYSDKVTAPVRELMTNAFDSHAAVGKADTPFLVTVPVDMDPVFGVRDFGEGMDHETVMDLYTTLFASSKEGTNEQVGMLGLGSKSPFAYTDAFTVTCYDGSEKRSYAAFLEQDVPKLAVVERSPSTDPTGVHVQFPVNMYDIKKFVRAIKSVALGFDVLPEFDGAEVTHREVLHEGSGWKIYARSNDWQNKDSLDQLSIRQGCVVYPGDPEGTDLAEVSMPTEMALMVDVPVGTSDVVSSREALSGDTVSREAVAKFVNAAWADYKAFVTKGYEACQTQLEKATFASKVDSYWRHDLGLPRNLSLSLLGRDWTNEKKTAVLKRRQAGRFVLTAKKQQVQHEFSYDSLGNIEIIVDDDETVRRRSRVLIYARQAGSGYRGGNVFILPSTKGQAHARKRIQRELGLDDSQFIEVADLEDPGPPARSKNGKAASRTKKSDLQSRLDVGTPWVRSMRGKVYLPHFSTVRFTSGWGRTAKESGPQDTVPPMDSTMVCKALGVQVDPTLDNDAAFNRAVVRLTDKQIEVMQPNPAREASLLISAACVKHAPTWQTLINAGELMRDIRRGVTGYGTATKLFEALNLSDTVPPEVGTAARLLHGSMERVVSVQTAEVRAAFQEVKDAYPALFPLDETEVIDYIQQQTTNKEITI